MAFHQRKCIFAKTAVLLFLLLNLASSMEEYYEKSSFEEGTDGWDLNNWKRVKLDELKKMHPTFPHPLDSADKTILIPTEDKKMAVMTKNFTVPTNSTIEVFFTCATVGWKNETDYLASLSNPMLEILFDDVTVFDLDKAVDENAAKYASDTWNQFRLLSSYDTNFTLEMTVIGQRDSAENEIALSEIVIKMHSETANESVIEIAGPETDMKEEDGSWEKISFVSESAFSSEKNVSPAFCDLMAERGPCHGYMRRYFYNVSQESCQPFTYGGCLGNDNNFRTSSRCEAVCKRATNLADSLLAVGGVGDNDQGSPGKVPHDTNLLIDFDNGFLDWDHKYMHILGYSSNRAKLIGLDEPMNKSSTKGATPNHVTTLAFVRPRIMHAVHLVRDHELEIRFSLRVQSEFAHPLLSLFFESLNPGMKIYIGDYKLFDYRSNGIRNQDWHGYSVNTTSNSILNFRHLTNSGGNMQLVRIEAWQGSGGKGTLVIDDFSLTQAPVSRSTLPTTTNRSTGLLTSSKAPMTSSAPIATSNAPSTTTTTTSVCDLPKDPGQTCSSSMKRHKRYFFDAEARSCLVFEFSGCGGNANNFANYGECSDECHPLPTTTTTTTSTTTSEQPTTRVIVTEGEKEMVCSAIPPAGTSQRNCNGDERLEGKEPFFYHNIATKTCEEGCGVKDAADGSKFVNHFASRSQCESACIEEGPPPVGFHIKSCLLAPVQGPCRDFSTRYFYRAESRTCQMFGYGGCAGNSNNFRSKSACDKFCGGAEAKVELKDDNSTEVCSWGKDSGSCSDSVDQFYYNPETKKCEKFAYSGCGGNPNRFPSLDKCLERCSSAKRNHAQPLEEPSDSSKGGGGLSRAAEVGLGVCLSLLLLAAVGAGLWFYKQYRDKENYRIFQNQLDRQSSASVSDLNGNQFDMTAYANPVYDPGRREVNPPAPVDPVVHDDLVLQPRPGEEINHSEYESTA